MRRGAFALITHDHKLLMLLRDNEPGISSPNCWSLIGGGIEVGESSEEALIREIKEECNLSIITPKFLFTTAGGSSDIYLVKLTNPQIKQIKLGNEGQRLAFWNIDDLAKLKLGRKMSYYFKKHYLLLKQLLEE